MRVGATHDYMCCEDVGGSEMVCWTQVGVCGLRWGCVLHTIRCVQYTIRCVEHESVAKLRRV